MTDGYPSVCRIAVRNALLELYQCVCWCRRCHGDSIRTRFCNGVNVAREQKQQTLTETHCNRMKYVRVALITTVKRLGYSFTQAFIAGEKSF